MASMISKNRLACTSCRRVKVRCNRAFPACQRCLAQQLECSYPNRRPRNSQSKIRSSTLYASLPLPARLWTLELKRSQRRDESSALSAILERLEHVENQTTAKSLSPASTTTLIPPAQVTTLNNATDDDFSRLHKRPSFRPSRPNGSPASRGSVNLDLTAPLSSLPELENRSDATSIDITSILSSAVDNVQQLRKKHNFGASALTLESVTIPPDYAKQWIHNYFTNINGKLLPAMVDRKLIDMMPDLIGMDHVHFDASMLVIYYCILWQGLFFRKPTSCTSTDRHYARQVFICCKRTIPIWQQEATCTVTDFIAAMYMTQTATENFDFSLSWEMHRLACEYAQTLQMHSLDGLEHSERQLSMSDDDRRGMWGLIHLDLFFRLINDKPAAFSSQLHDWRVDMPRLTVELSHERNEAVPTMAFIIRSRLTFILISYFQVSDTLKCQSDVLTAINPLCEDVEKIFDEWKIENWLESYKEGDINGWVLGDLALSGYTCILFMLRKASLPKGSAHRSLLSDNDDMIPRSDLSVRTSRRVLKVIHHMIHILKLPGPEAMSLILGNYRAYIAHAHLASGLIHDPMASTAEEDLRLLQNVAECTEALAREVNEFFPLTRAFKLVNNEVKKRL
ncbi:hypothetical protein BDV36DRAFT_303474 [Aspergillus pseudocaelatus]|uniref:Zn(2)-C6 fungal-type domain-containing protein n=1 Tax=Aspergillus pseudocaelatus TaxID=1825620 RepID=A0ABQ6WB70_9EURO|nr:hypothetical protein BDV36DRAFT_303474 [Aspergillus pseudocaelatus]